MYWTQLVPDHRDPDAGVRASAGRLPLSHQDPIQKKTSGFAGGLLYRIPSEIYSRKSSAKPPAAILVRCAKTATLLRQITCLRYDLAAFMAIRLR